MDSDETVETIAVTLAEQLKEAIEQSGQTRYRIAKETGVDYYTLARFLDEGRGIQLSTVQKLADYFGMRLTKARAARKEQD